MLVLGCCLLSRGYSPWHLTDSTTHSLPLISVYMFPECMKKAVSQSSSTAEKQPSSPSSQQDSQVEAQEQAMATPRVVVDESPSLTSPTGDQQEQTAPPTDEQVNPLTEGQQEQASPPTEQAAPPTDEQVNPLTEGQQEQASPPTEQAAPPTDEQVNPLTEGQQEQAAPPSKEQQEQAAPPSKEQQEQTAPPPSTEEDPLAVASKMAAPEDASIGNQEKAFAVIWMDRMMGLLAAVLPKELSVRQWVGGK